MSVPGTVYLSLVIIGLLTCGCVVGSFFMVYFSAQMNLPFGTNIHQDMYATKVCGSFNVGGDSAGKLSYANCSHIWERDQLPANCTRPYYIPFAISAINALGVLLLILPVLVLCCCGSAMLAGAHIIVFGFAQAAVIVFAVIAIYKNPLGTFQCTQVFYGSRRPDLLSKQLDGFALGPGFYIALCVPVINLIGGIALCFMRQRRRSSFSDRGNEFVLHSLGDRRLN